jgi:hypothetical protein
VYNLSNEIILCGDFNVNYLNDNTRKDCLNSLLAFFNLYSIINFPTRISYNSCTLIDNIYIDDYHLPEDDNHHSHRRGNLKSYNIYINSYLHAFSVHPLINGLSDHDAQIIVLNNITVLDHKQIFYHKRVINNYTIGRFLFLLSYENWEDVFSETNVNIAFNKFLNIFLRIYNSCFPLKKFQFMPKLSLFVYIELLRVIFLIF